MVALARVRGWAYTNLNNDRPIGLIPCSDNKG